MSDNLKVIAQRRTLLNRFKEKKNYMLGGKHDESVSELYKNQMDIIRTTDNANRELVNVMKSDLKNARRAFRDRRLLDVSHWLGQFNTKMRLIIGSIDKFKELKSDEFDDFYTHTSDTTDPYFNYLDSDLKEAVGKVDDMFKTAGLLDVFKSDREKASRLLEKMYQKQLKKRLDDINVLLNKADGVLGRVVEEMAALDTARAEGNVNEYIKHLTKISGYHKTFEDKLREVYTNHFQPLAAKLKTKEESEEAEVQKQLIDLEKKRQESREQLGVQPEIKKEVPMTVPDLEVPEPKVVPVENPEQKIFDAEFEEEEPVIVTSPNTIMTNMLPAKDESKEQKAAKLILKNIKKLSKEEFYNELVKASNDPFIMSAMIAKYSQELEDDGDIETGLKLLSIAELIF